jgi:hypothetical protein
VVACCRASDRSPERTCTRPHREGETCIRSARTSPRVWERVDSSPVSWTAPRSSRHPTSLEPASLVVASPWLAPGNGSRRRFRASRAWRSSGKPATETRADWRRGRAGRNQKRAGARRRLRDWLVDCAPPSVERRRCSDSSSIVPPSAVEVRLTNGGHSSRMRPRCGRALTERTRGSSAPEPQVVYGSSK